MLELDVTVERRDLTLEASLEVAPGERVAIFGPSGAGKTTLLESVAGFVTPTCGRVALNGRVLASGPSPRVDVPVWSRRIGFLRQRSLLFPHLDVAANLAYGKPTADAARRDALLEALGIGDLLAAYPAALSGGETQRVAICRLLLRDSDALLLDEPYGGLDASRRRIVSDLVAEDVVRRALPTLLVAHELAEAQAFADRLVLLDGGSFLDAGDPHRVVADPASRRAAELVGYTSFLAASSDEIIGLHPARLRLGAFPERGVVLRGRLLATRPAHAGYELDLDVAGELVTCLSDECAGEGEHDVTALDPPRFARAGGARRRS